MALDTIRDFDFGVGGRIMDTQRVAYGPKNVAKFEVDFIVWLMLEQEFRRKTKLASGKPVSGCRTQVDSHDDDDIVDSSISTTNFRICLANDVARKYAEDVLNDVGMGMSLNSLTETDRQTVLMQLCRNNRDLLLGNTVKSVPEVFRALRCSKFASNFNVVSSIGKGEFGEVYHVQLTENVHKEYAVKKITCSLACIKHDVPMALNESKLLKILKGHRNIIAISDYWLEIEPDSSGHESHDNYNEDDDVGPLKFYMQLELCSLSLDKWKEINHARNIIIERSKIVDIVFQIFNGLSFIHEKGIIHLDIKPMNVIWKTQDCIDLKIVDFGLAVIAESIPLEPNGQKPGTPPYIAPEDTLTSKSDIYSASLTIIEVGKPIHTRAELSHVIETKQYNVGESVLDEILLRGMDENPNERPSAASVLQSLSHTHTASLSDE